METTKVYLNDWASYNNGCIGFGWMDTEEAREFIEVHSNEDREWFIADIDNYLSVDFGNLNYCNVNYVLDTIDQLEDMPEWQINQVMALMEYNGLDDIQCALYELDEHIFYSSIDEYYDNADYQIKKALQNNEIALRYFDWDSYHDDLNYDIYEASNGIVISYL